MSGESNGESPARAESEGSAAGSAPGEGMRVRMFARTDVGQVREHNEDNFIVANLAKRVRGLREENRCPLVEGDGLLLGVCDGMGGAAAGEIASQLAVDIIYDHFVGSGPLTDQNALARRLVEAIEQAGARIFQEARADRTRRGMGTTATIAGLRDGRLFVGQVGDSRAYLLRSGKLVQLTRDQSLVNQLIEAGQLTEEEAETFEHNNIILQALGTAETVQVDLTYVDLRAGDVLMLCSDGLSGMIRSEEIHEVLSRVEDPLEACRELTDRANTAGGHDNITVLVARFGEGLRPPEPGDTFGYQKYALPEVAVPSRDSSSGRRRGEYDTRPEGPVSEEARREGRSLRVSHTMLGVASPRGAVEGAPSGDDFSDETPPSGTPSPARRAGADSRAAASSRGGDSRSGVDGGPGADPKDALPPTVGGPTRRAARTPLASDPPIDLPTSGLPPAVMGAVVIAAMLVAGVFGFLALR
jgi:protein phosphatase